MWTEADRRRCATTLPCVLLVVAASVAASEAPASAQSLRSIDDAIVVGATAGVASNGDSHSGGGTGPRVSAHVEVPARRDTRLRVAVGHTRWTPRNESLASNGHQPGTVGLTDVAVTMIAVPIRPTPRYPFAIYGGLGAGTYRYSIDGGAFSKRRSLGVHGLGGFEYLIARHRYALRVESDIHATSGPRHDQVWATTLFTASISVGIARRF